MPRPQFALKSLLWLMAPVAASAWVFKIRREQAGVEIASKTLACLALPVLGVAAGRWGMQIGERQHRSTTVRLGRAAFWLFAVILILEVPAVLFVAAKDALGH